MDCQRFNDQLPAWLDGSLSPDELARAEAHAATCSRCSALSEMDVDSTRDETSDELTASILVRTSGSTCGRAHTLLGDQADGALPELDRELLEAHQRDCADCAALRTVIRRLGDDLPAFAEVDPDPGLVEDVLAQTSVRTATSSGTTVGITQWGRLGRAVRRLLERPRIAWEVGYVAAMVAWLVVGPSWSPLRSVPVQAVALIQQGAAGARAAGNSADAIARSMGRLGERSFGTAPSLADTAADGFAEWLSTRYRHAVAATPNLGGHWRQLAAALREGDLSGGAQAVQSLSRDAGAILQRLFSSRPMREDSGSGPEPRGPDNSPATPGSRSTP